MTFGEWRQQQKKKDEEKQQTRGGRQVDLYADDAQTQQGRRNSQQTRTISVNAPTYSSKKPTFGEWRAQQKSDYVTNWIRDSQNLLNDTYQYSKSWSNDKTKYTNLKSRASGLLYSADWIKEMTSQDKDSSKYVGDIIDALSKAGTVRDDAQKYYSQFDTQDAYQMVQDYSTPEGRRKRYQNNKEKLALLQDELQEIQESGGVIGEGRYNPAKPWTGADTASDLRKEIAAIQAEITNYERGNTGKLRGFHSNELQSLQQQLDVLEREYAQEQKNETTPNFLTDREQELFSQIQALRSKIAGASENSFYYGNKAADDAYFLTKNNDFAENSRNRSFGNSTKEQFDQYYYDVYGGEAINPKTGEVVATHRGLGYTDQSLDSLQINDPLGFWLDAEKSLENGAVQYNSGGTQYREYDAILARAEANDWDQLTNDEVSVYYYLMNTQGKKAASDFLDSMSRTLQRRQTEQDIKDATALYDEANVLGKIMLSIATIPALQVSNVVGFAEDTAHLLTGQEYNPYSKLKQGQTFTQAIRDATAQDLDATGFKIPVLDFTLGDIYQAGMSVLDSALLTGTLRIAGGIEAAEKAMYFMGMGAAESEARKLYEAGASDDQIAMGAAASGIAEALFEKVSIENLVSIRSPESVLEMVKNIMVQGGVEASEEAFTEIANIITNSLIMDSQSEWAQSVMEHNGDTKAAFVDKVQQVAQAAFGGFLSGAASSTLHQGAAYADRQYQNYQVGHAIQQTEGGTDALMQLAQDVSESADKKTAKKITRQGQKVVGYQKGTGIANDIRTGRLYDSTIRAITLNQANVIQKALIEAEVDPDYAKQITGAMRAQAYGLELTSAQEKALQKAGQNKTVQDVISRVTSNGENAWSSRQNQARSLAEGVIIGDARGAQTAQQLYREAEQRVSDTGHAVMKESGDEIEVKGVASIQRGEMILNIGGGETVNANDIQYANADQAVLYQTVANMGGIVDAQTAQKIIDNFDTSGNLSAQAYASGMRQAYMYGVYGYSASDVKNGAMSSGLSGEQQVLAYTLGAQYGTVLRSHQPGLVMDDYVQENIAPDMADKINKTARLLGVRVQFADSQAVGGGDANAQLQDGVILIEKGNPNPVMAILGHEWTHQIQDLAASEYETFKKSISSDPDVQAEASRLFDLYKRKGHPLTEDGAMDEAVANYAGRLINETDVLDKFLAENKQNKTLLQKMVDGIRKLIRKVTGAEKRQLQTVEGKLLAAMNAATETADKVNINPSANGNVQYSLKTVNGERVVWIENSPLSNKELNDHRAVANFIAQHIGEVYTIIESGQHVYIGKDLPSEYTQSKYTSYLRKTDRALVKAKNKAVDGFGELIETATNRRWEKTRHQDSKDAKYGMYRYDTTFAFPVMANGKMQRIRAYDAELLIRNASNGKKYLYDIVGIKENATAHISLSQREARLAAYQETATGGNVSNTSISTSPGNVKAKFSLKESVEETKDLIAVHNVSEEGLQGALDLGGLPSPSIAITKDDMGHEKYGPISLVFGKETIDPQFFRANKVYGSDAWTPTAPRVDYQVNGKKLTAIESEFHRLAGNTNVAGGIFGNSSALRSMGIDDTSTKSVAEIAKALSQTDTIRAAYMADNGETLEPVKQAKVWDRYGNDALKSFVDQVGSQRLAEMLTALELGDSAASALGEDANVLDEIIRDYYKQSGEAILRRMAVHKKWTAEQINEQREARIDRAMENVSPFAKEDFIRHAWEMYQDGGATKGEIDRLATSEALRAAVNDSDVEAWAAQKLDGLLGKAGIYNGKDPFTPSGNSRSFSQLHYDYTLENIVRAMNETQAARGEGIWGASAGTLAATASPEYQSVDEIRADKGRLRRADDTEYNALKAQLDSQIEDVITGIRKGNRARFDNAFEEIDQIGTALVEVSKGKKTDAAIRKGFRSYGYTLSDQVLSQVEKLYQDAAAIPTEYFEAKPQRAVGFDEVLAAIVPNNTSQVILDELHQRGVNTISYEAGNSEDRLAKLNSVENAKFSIKGSERQADLVQLQNENDLLRQQVEYWKGQTKRTESVTTDKKSVLKAARSLVKGYSSTADVTEVAEQLQSLYDFIANNGDANNELTYEDVRGRAESIAEDIVQNAVLADDDLRAQYADLRAYVRGTTLRVTDAIKDSIPDFNDWRKANFGSLRIANGNSTNIDQVYQELSYQWPEFFNEEQTGNPADQLQQIADVMQTISQVTERNPFAYDMEAAVSGVANEILENFFDLPQTKATFADKQAFKLQEAKAAGKQRLQAQQAASKAKMQQLRNENRQRVQDAITAERMNAGKQIAQLKNKYAAKTQAQKESRNAKELRAKITRHTAQLSKKLLSPTDNAHIPELLRGPVATMLEAINQETGYSWGEGGKLIRSEEGNPTKRTQAFQELANQYAQIMKDQNSFDGVLDPDIDEKLLDVVNLKDLRLNEMSTAQLRTVWEAVRAVEMSIQTAGKVLTEGKYQSTQEWANAFQQDASGRKTKGHITPNHFALALETPYTFFSHFGDAGVRVYRMLRDAQDHQQRMVDQVSEEVQKIVDPKTVKKLETTRHTFKTARGDTLTLTTAQAMDLYNLMKRKQAQKHLEQGGVMQPEIKWHVGSNDRTIERGTDATLLSETDLTNIVGVLTKEETKIADDLQRLTVTTLAAFGNEASMTAYGYKKFTGSDYWPIRAATEQTKTDTENNSSGKQRSIKNIGMAKSTTPGASNAVELRGVFDTFARHASDMIDYSAWLVPMEDANHLFNYRFREAETGKTLKTIKGIIERTAGKGGQRYWQNLMDNIQNGISGDWDSTWETFGKTVGSFKGAAVGGNIRVVIQQPTAWVRAAYVLNPVNMAKGLIKGVTDGNGWAKAKKYAEIAARKANGSFDISSPYSLDETLFDKKSTLRKTSDALSWAAGQADAITWGRLWNACEWQVHQQNAALRPGSTEFYSEVAKTFTDMIDQTQVVDGVLQRAQVMRARNEVVKQATSFMGEPLMSLNLMMRSYDAFRYTQDKGKRKTALRKMGRAASALVMTAAVNALAQSLVDAFRDDDDDKTYAQRYWSAFTGVTGEETGVLDWVNSLTLEGNFGGNLNPLTQIPFVKDYISLAQGYDVSRTEMEVVSDLIRAGQTFVQNIGGNGPKTQAYALKEVFAAGAKLFGLPVSNLTRDIWALARTIVNDSGNLPVQYQMEKAIYNLSNGKNKSRFLDLLYKALARGDMDTYQHIRSELSAKMGLDGATIDSALKTRYNNQRKKDPSYSLPDTTLAMIGIRKSVTLPTEEPSFSAKDLTDAQYQVYAQQKAEDYETLISHIEKNKTFQAMSDSTKDKVYRMAYNYTDHYALADNSDGAYEVSTDWMVKAKAASKKGTKVWDYLVDYVQNSEDNTAKNEAYTNMYTALENGDIKEYQRIRNQVMRELELNGTDINSAMKSKYNAAKKANPSYKLDQKVLDLLGIVEKRGTAKNEEETFSAGNLSSSAYTSYETQRSTEYRQTATGVSGSSWFRGLDADDQDKVYAFAYQLAEEEALKDNSRGEYEISTKWIKEAANAQYYGLEDWQYTLFHSAYALATTDRDASGKAIKGQGKADKVRRWLNEQNLTEEQRAWLWSTVYSSEW